MTALEWIELIRRDHNVPSQMVHIVATVLKQGWTCTQQMNGDFDLGAHTVCFVKGSGGSPVYMGAHQSNYCEAVYIAAKKALEYDERTSKQKEG